VTFPASTYRLQLREGVGLREAARLVDYLDALGISSLYLSPVWKAVPESTHGYDVADPNTIDEDLGGEGAVQELIERLESKDMTLLLDIVPNHMAASHANPWWFEVLQHGPGSRFASFFDVDWERYEGRILLPVLGGPFEQLHKQGEFGLITGAPWPALEYGDRVFPLDPATVAPLLDEAAARTGDGRTALELKRVAEELRALRPRREGSQSGRAEKASATGDALQRVLTTPAGDAFGEILRELTARLDRLQGLLDEQVWILEHYLTGIERINYRRFFDIADLVCVRTENPAVVDVSHRKIAEVAASHKAIGVRVDHVDGMADPGGYLEHLRSLLPAGTWIVVEKILAPGEALPESWPVDGTTGYEFLTALDRVFVAPQGVQRLGEIAARFTGVSAPFVEVERRSKEQVIRQLFPGEVHRLTEMLVGQEAATERIAETFDALVKVTAALRVYRTYGRGGRFDSRERHILDQALAALDSTSPNGREAVRGALLEAGPFLQRWQQLTGPVAAKGVEDTALYRYPRLWSLNEVGGDPDAAVGVEDFHALNAERLAHWPGGLSPTSTHDTNRSEEVRARLAVLSEVPEEWDERLERWAAMNRSSRRRDGGVEVPDPVQEHLLYQTLVGAWPVGPPDDDARDFASRIVEYMGKAAREARVHTSWLRPDAAYEDALEHFTRAVLEDKRFTSDLSAFAEKIAYYGFLNSLSMSVLKLISPGIADLYHGNEAPAFRLVDPDNRRPVDFGPREGMLRSIDDDFSRDPAGFVSDALTHWQDGRAKMHVLARGLRIRRSMPDVFLQGQYLPLSVEGPRAEQLVAVARRRETRWALAVASRLVGGFASREAPPIGPATWEGTAIRMPDGTPRRWLDALTSREIDAAAGLVMPAWVLRSFPVALLVAG
jgi:(1->4)-alpha-D-glucan 1-alpha-D-glucosylmutase